MDGQEWEGAHGASAATTARRTETGGGMGPAERGGMTQEWGVGNTPHADGASTRSIHGPARPASTTTRVESRAVHSDPADSAHDDRTVPEDERDLGRDRRSRKRGTGGQADGSVCTRVIKYEDAGRARSRQHSEAPAGDATRMRNAAKERISRRYAIARGPSRAQAGNVSRTVWLADVSLGPSHTTPRIGAHTPQSQDVQAERPVGLI